MSELQHREIWTWDAYLGWEAEQPFRHELIDGQVRAMTGGTFEQGIICNNLRGELWNRLEGRPCRTQGPDLKVKAGDNIRYPDALIDCGPRVTGTLFAQQPVAIFEVLSKSTAWIDQGLKLRDYDATPSVRYYVLINQDEPRALVYARDSTGRLSGQNAGLIEGLDAMITLPELELTIAFSRIYRDMTFA